MNRRISAAVVRFAALGGLFIVPTVATAQLKCLSAADKEIRSVSFEGNRQFTDPELQRRVLSEPTDRLRRIFRRFVGTRRCLHPGLLSSDSARLKAFYSDQGFPDAKVRDTVRTGGPRWVDITFMINEGEPIVIDSLSIEGLQGLDLGDDLLRSLKSKVGGRFSSAFVLTDIDSIETRLRNSGYPLGAVLQDVGATGHRARVGLKVIPGPRTRIGQITILDTAITGRPPVIKPQAVRQLLAFKEGDLYRERALVQTQRQLYQLGTFYHAEVAPDTTHDILSDSLAYIRVRVVEDYMRQLNYRGGWGTQDCFQTGLQYSDKAFAHSINRFELSGQVSKLGWAKPTSLPGARDLCHSSLKDDEIASSTLNYNTTVRLTQPASFGGRLDRSFAAYSEIRGAYKAYLRTTIVGGAASLSKLLSERPAQDEAFKRRLVGQMSYNLEYGHTDAPPAVLCFVFRACQEAERDQLSRDRPLAVLSGVMSRDWRNSPLVPTSGTMLRVEGRVSSRLLGSDKDLQFRKGVGDATWYHQGIRSDVIAIRFRGGLIGGGAATGGARLVPPQERLYTGGETSVRGFGQNELGPLIYVVDSINPVDSTFATPRRVIPTGGNAMLVWNFEYRVHGPFFGNRLQTILFADAGKVWTRGVDQFAQPYKWTPGVAFRVFSPFGPIQVNFGYNNYRRPLGAVFYDPGIGSSVAPLVCVSNTTPSTSGDCQPTYSPPLPAATIRSPFTLLRRIKLTIAFPPDY